MSKAGPSGACLELIGNDRIRLVMSETVLAEIKDVISRPDLRELSVNLVDEKTEELIELILEKAEFVEDVRRYFKYSRDETDEPYINLAIKTDAAFLITRDNDLLDLMTSHSDDAKEFRQRFRHLKIVAPIEFLRIIREIDLALKPS